MMDLEESEVTWRGIPIFSMSKSFNKPLYPPLKLSEDHTILVKLPIVSGQIPEPYPPLDKSKDIWNNNVVRMPCSDQNLYPVSEDTLRKRWELVKEALQGSIRSSHQLQTAICMYNSEHIDSWDFNALHAFFEETVSESECEMFFDEVFPKLVTLALQLPQLITTGIPLLRCFSSHSITLSQLQIASLLANAFLCTFPRRYLARRYTARQNSEYVAFPDINFNRLFQCRNKSKFSAVQEKLKCIINYFRRVTEKVPDGVVTFSRRYVAHSQLPNWSQNKNTIRELHISSTGTIEEDGIGMLQMDFADKLVGGGVISHGSVQEEIRFVICPELILSRLFTQRLEETEVLVVTGCEQFSRYKGYGRSFKFDGNYVDTTPIDEYGRKHAVVLAADALNCRRKPTCQYAPHYINRELNKAYVGFSWGVHVTNEPSTVATGNWGCGIFCGNKQLKTILQLMAAAEAGRMLAYFTFGDDALRDSVHRLHILLRDKNISIGGLYALLGEFYANEYYKTQDICPFLYNAISKRSSQPQAKGTLQFYFSKKVLSSEAGASKNNSDQRQQTDTKQAYYLNDDQINEIMETEDDIEMMLRSSKSSTDDLMKKECDIETKSNKTTREKEIFDELHNTKEMKDKNNVEIMIKKRKTEMQNITDI